MRRILCAALVAAACTPSDESGEPADTAVVVTSSEMSAEIEAKLDSFRAGLEAPQALEGGARSADSLVSRLLRAISKSDTMALRRMLLSRAEFAYLTYPTSVVAHEPYELEPANTWFLAQEASEKGISRALRRWGGRELSYIDHECPRVEQEGPNTVHGDCTARWTVGGRDTVALSLFRAIIEREGRFKFLSYGNTL